jgi:hypothetical protein
MTRSAAAKDPPEAEPAPLAGTHVFERADWLPKGSGLDWLEAVREAHLAAVRLFTERAVEVAELQREQREVFGTWRRQVRAAVAVGDEPPPKPEAETHQARTELASEDAAEARDALALPRRSVRGAAPR